LELRDDGTGNFKHLVQNAKMRAKDYLYRDDQEGGSEVLMERLGDCVKEFKYSIFDTRSNESLVIVARKPILLSGKKKSNKMANLQLMHPKYKDELEKDDYLKFICSLLSAAGITRTTTAHTCRHCRARGCVCVYAGGCDGVCMEESVCVVCSV
jgi:hypothetical protein